MRTTILSDNRRYTHPSTSFADPAIVKFIEKAHTLPEQQPLEHYDDDEEEDTTTVPSSFTSSPLMTQRLSSPQPTASTSLDHLWSQKERYNSMELRIFSLEEAEKRFECRLEALEKERNDYMLTLQKQAMKPDQQSASTDNMHHDLDDAQDQKNYMELYHSLLEKYNALQVEFKHKEEQYEKRLQALLKAQAVKKPQEQKPCYREENGYLLFDTTNMNGEIMQCKVKIPVPQRKPPQCTRRGNFITTTLTASQKMRSSLQPNYMNTFRHITSPKTALNPNAPEWKKKDSQSYYRS